MDNRADGFDSMYQRINIEVFPLDRDVSADGFDIDFGHGYVQTQHSRNRGDCTCYFEQCRTRNRLVDIENYSTYIHLASWCLVNPEVSPLRLTAPSKVQKQ